MTEEAQTLLSIRCSLFVRCSYSHIASQFLVFAYNPMGHKVTHSLRLPVPFVDGYRVKAYDNSVVESQVSLRETLYSHFVLKTPS